MIRSPSIPFRGLPLALFPSILPSITSLNNPSPLTTCPIQFFCLFLITLINCRFSYTLFKISSFVILSIQLPLSILHISIASNIFFPWSCPSFRSILMPSLSFSWPPYQMASLIILLSLIASLANAILTFISVSHLPSSVIVLPRYLNLFNCSILLPLIIAFISYISGHLHYLCLFGVYFHSKVVSCCIKLVHDFL